MGQWLKLRPSVLVTPVQRAARGERPLDHPMRPPSAATAAALRKLLAGEVPAWGVEVNGHGNGHRTG